MGKTRAGAACAEKREISGLTWISPDGFGLPDGAARGIRTPDPIITNDVLYRLSYCGGIRRL